MKISTTNLNYLKNNKKTCRPSGYRNVFFSFSFGVFFALAGWLGAGRDNIRESWVRLEQWLFNPPPPTAGLFSTGISANVTVITAPDEVIYTINYRTGSVDMAVSGARVVLDIPVPGLSAAQVVLNSNPDVDVANTTLNTVAGGLEYDIRFNPMAAGKVGFIQLTVSYPRGLLCDGQQVALSIESTVQGQPSDDPVADDNEAAITVNDSSDPWSIDLVINQLRTIGQNSSLSIDLKRQSGSVFNLSNATVSLQIPAGALVVNCSACNDPAANPLTWGPTNYSTNTSIPVLLRFDNPPFDHVGNSSELSEVFFQASFSGQNTTCSENLSDSDSESGQIPAPAPPVPAVNCTSPQIDSTTIGVLDQEIGLFFENSGTAALNDFTYEAYFPNEARITAIPAATYSDELNNVQVTYYTTDHPEGQTYSFNTSTATASGGRNLSGFLRRIRYEFGTVPPGFQPTQGFTFFYSIQATDVEGNPINAANPRVSEFSCISCSDDAANAEGFDCFGVRTSISGVYNGNPYADECEVGEILRSSRVGPQDLDKSSDANNYFPEDTVEFTLSFDQCGTEGLQNATIEDELPEGLTYISGSARFGNTPLEPANPLSQVLLWNLGSLQGAALPTECVTYTVTYRARVNPGVKASTLENCFTVGGVMMHPDGLEECSDELTECHPITIDPVGPVMPEKTVRDLTAPTNFFFPEDEIEYTLRWKHQSSFTVTELMVTDKLPGNLSFLGELTYSSNIQSRIDAYRQMNPNFDPFSQNGQDLSWDFNGLVFDGNNEQYEIRFKAKINTGTAPGNLRNCFQVSGMGNNVRMDAVEACRNLQVQPVGPVNMTKAANLNSASPTQSFQYTIRFRNSGAFEVNGVQITDILPADLEFGGEGSISYTNLPEPDTFTYTAASNSLRWTWSQLPGAPSGQRYSEYAEISFQVRVKPGTAANTTLTNCFALDARGDNIDVRRSSDGEGGMNIAEPCANEVRVLKLAAVESRKGIKGQCDSNFVFFDPAGPIPNLNNLNGIGRTFPGGNATYRLEIYNPGNVVLRDLLLIDILPHQGDVGVSRIDETRLTEWRPNLASPITAPDGVQVFYSLETNPCRSEFEPANAIQAPGCTGPDWLSSPPPNLTDIQAVKIKFNRPIQPGERIILDWDMTAPFAAPENQIAWNSFAYQVYTDELPAGPSSNDFRFQVAEPNKVGLAVKRDPKGSFGNYVWVDMDEDGIQDEGPSFGVNDIRVRLYRSQDMVKGNDDDELVSTTVTGFDYHGNPGYYLFPNLDAGKYYAVFSPASFPETTEVTNSGQGDEDSDSDVDPVMGMTDLVEITEGQPLLNVDMGLTPPDCDLNSTLIVPVCDDNGTPANPNDDLITVQSLTGRKEGAAGGSSFTLLIVKSREGSPDQQLEVITNQPYNTAIGPFGPYGLAGDEEISVTVIDSENPLCRLTDVVLGCYDFGDLPESYTTSGPSAPRHLVQRDKFLGSCVDSDIQGQPSAMADGDNNSIGPRSEGNCGAAGNDEDGIDFITPLFPGEEARIRVTYLAPPDSARLNGFIDFDGNGQFDIGEIAADDQLDFYLPGSNPESVATDAILPPGQGEIVLCFRVPANARFRDGNLFARFRLSCDGGLGPTGVNSDGSVPPGEVEDYHEKLAKVGNLVWEDRNFDGRQDNGEVGVANVELTLTYTQESDNFQIKTTTSTDSLGLYYFCGLIADSTAEYTISAKVPADWTPAAAGQGQEIIDSDNDSLIDEEGMLLVRTRPFQITDPMGLPTQENGLQDQRDEYSDLPDLNAVGSFPDAQVDQRFDFAFAPLDYGDLPEEGDHTAFNTSSEAGGPRHVIQPGKMLGACVDAERDGAPSGKADGDDLSGSSYQLLSEQSCEDDENGIELISPLIPGSEACIRVVYQLIDMPDTDADGYLAGWIDFNGDGDFTGDPQEQLQFTIGGSPAADAPLNAGKTSDTLCFVVPFNTAFNQGIAFMRFRLSCETGLGPDGISPTTGLVPPGEVEDYYLPLYKVGNLVWEDGNFDGSQNEGENPLSSVLISLNWAGYDGILGSADDRTYLDTTNTEGRYQFCGLLDGDVYKITVQSPDAMTPSRPNVNSNQADRADSDGVFSDPMAGMVMDSFTLMAQAIPVGENSLADQGTLNGFPDEAADETHDFGFAPLDYGDLPQEADGEQFSTAMADGGPVHVLNAGLFLGTCADAELDGRPDAESMGDDEHTGSHSKPGACTDDEDGIRLLTPLAPGYEACIQVQYTAPVGGAVLQAWIDWNGDGELSPREALAFSGGGVLAAGSGQVIEWCFPVPEEAVFNDGVAFLRVRLSPEGGLLPNGPDKYDESTTVPLGEVEDYLIKLAKVGNLVWEDRNYNGLQDAEEADLGLNEVAVELIFGGTLADGSADAIGPDGSVADRSYTTFTAPQELLNGELVNGIYYFCGLVNGRYELRVTDPQHLTPTLPDAGDEEDADSDGIPLLPSESGENARLAVRFELENLMALAVDEDGTGDQDAGRPGDPNQVGSFPDSQVDQRFDFGYVALDFGDLPDTAVGQNYRFSTRLQDEGPRHIVTPDKYLGACVDAERNGQPDGEAGYSGAGDDSPNAGVYPQVWKQPMESAASCTDDGNGVELVTPLVPGYEACIELSYHTTSKEGPDAYLHTWIDFNGNGELDPEERIRYTKINGKPAPLDAGSGALILEEGEKAGGNPVLLCFEVPADARFLEGSAFARFRLSCEPGLGPNGVYAGGKTPYGEVEDYVFPLAKVGNLVWEDRNFNGLQDAAEAGLGINGVPVALIFSGKDGLIETADAGNPQGDDRVYTTQTATIDGVAGLYYFCGLIENHTYNYQYKLIFTDPADMTPTRPDASSNSREEIDSDGEDATRDGEIQLAGMVMTPFEILRAGQQPTGEKGLSDEHGDAPETVLNFPDEHANQRFDQGYAGLDYGDLPDNAAVDTDFPSWMEETGAVHVVQPGKFLGACVDAELDAKPDSLAGAFLEKDPSYTPGGDDYTGSQFRRPAEGACADDENGIRFVTPLIPGFEACVEVTYTLDQSQLTPGEVWYLKAWMDFNGNNRFDGPQEIMAFTGSTAQGLPLEPTGAQGRVIQVCFPVPATATFQGGKAYARFRMSNRANLSPGGPQKYDARQPMPAGEVEDYFVPLAKVGNLAWLDRNLAGDQNGGTEEPALTGVNLYLLFAGANGVIDTDVVDPQQPGFGAKADDRVYLEKTDATGRYYFCGLIEGKYQILPEKYQNLDQQRDLGKGYLSVEGLAPRRLILTVPNKTNQNSADDPDSDGNPGTMLMIPDLLKEDLVNSGDDDPQNENGFLDQQVQEDGFPDVQDNQTLDFGWVPEPNLEALACIVGVDYPSSETCGHFNVLLDVCIKNTAEIPLEKLSALLDLQVADAFGAALVGVAAAPYLIDAKTTARVRPGVNSAYNGRNHTNLLDGSSGLLYPGETVCIRLEFEINPKAVGAPSPFRFQSLVSGKAVNFNGTPIPDFFQNGRQFEVSDLSSGNKDFFNDYDDPDQKTLLDDRCWEKSRQMAAIGEVKVTMRENCATLVRPDMVIEQHFPACDLEAYPEGGFYRVIIQDAQTFKLLWSSDTGEPFDASPYAGQKLIYRVRSVSYFCEPVWGYLILEDKTPPVVSCPPMVIGLVKTFIEDKEWADYLADKSPVLIDGKPYTYRPGLPEDTNCPGLEDKECLETCDDKNPDFNYLVCTDLDKVLNVPASWSDERYAYFTGKPTVVDCSPVELIEVRDVLRENDCSKAPQIAFGRQLGAIVERSFTFRDKDGNTSSCTQLIYFFRPEIDLPSCRIDLDNCDYPALTASNTKTILAPTLIKAAPSYENAICQRVPMLGHTCNLSLNFEDQVLPGPENCGLKVIRIWTFLDWCWQPGACDLLTAPAGCEGYLSAWDNKKRSFEQQIVIGDKTAPKLACPEQKINGSLTTVQQFSTGPFECKAVINPLPPVVSGECQSVDWEFELRGDVMDPKTGLIRKDQLIASSGNSKIVFGIAPGQYVIRYFVKDKCGNASSIDCRAEVVDKVAPIALCDNDLHISIGGVGVTGEGLARVTAADIDEGSWDNCELVGIEVRRHIGSGCLDLYGRLVNGLQWPAEYETRQGPNGSTLYLARKAAPAKNVKAGDTLVIREADGRFFSWWASELFFTCCDISSDNADRRLVELRATDKSGNRNNCWMNVLIEDKLPPRCEVRDLSIECTSLDFDPLAAEKDPSLLHARFGKPESVVTVFDNCGVSLAESVKWIPGTCGAGALQRSFTLTDNGGRQTLCVQKIVVQEVNDYAISFPGDLENLNCGVAPVEDVQASSYACDILALNRDTVRFDSEGESEVCFKLLITHKVINWCEFDGEALASTVISRDLDSDGDLGEKTYLDAHYERIGNLNAAFPICGGNWANIDDNDGKADSVFVVKIYSETNGRKNALPDRILVRGTCPDRNTHVGFAAFRLLRTGDAKSPVCYERFCGTDNVAQLCQKGIYADQCWIPGYYRFTQIVKVKDQQPPTLMVENRSLEFCAYGSPETDCNGQVDIFVKIDDECTPALSRIRQLQLIVNNTGSPQDLSGKLYALTNLGGQRYRISGRLPVGSHTFVAGAVDGCGNLSGVRIPFTVKDCKSPAPVCIQTLSIDLMPVDADQDGRIDGGMNTVWATDYIASPITDCSPFDIPGQVRYFAFKDSDLPFGKVDSVRLRDLTEARRSVVFTCEEEGAAVPTYIFALDAAGNFDYCLAQTIVRGGTLPGYCGEGGSGALLITGLLTTETQDPVEGAEVQLSGQSNRTITTGANGNYVFEELMEGADFTITPMLDQHPLNGVTTFDLVLISKHIIGVKPLDSPYKRIAADVNRSGSVTALDLIVLRKLILGLQSKLTNNTSWRFVDAAYVFPNPENPFASPFPQVLNVNNLSGNLRGDFIGIKVGDVNNNVRAHSFQAVEEREIAGRFDLQMDEVELRAGQTYEVPVNSRQLAEIQGFQGTLAFDTEKVELLGIEPGIAAEEHFGLFEREGFLTMSWNGEASGGRLFTLRLRAQCPGRLSEAVSIVSHLTHSEAYGTGDEWLDLGIDFGKAEVVQPRFRLYQNTPNPYQEWTRIAFELPEAGEVELRIQDVNGRLLKLVRGEFGKGYQEIRLDRDRLPGGVLTYTLTSGRYTASRQMVLVD